MIARQHVCRDIARKRTGCSKEENSDVRNSVTSHELYVSTVKLICEMIKMPAVILCKSQICLKCCLFTLSLMCTWHVRYKTLDNTRNFLVLTLYTMHSKSNSIFLQVRHSASIFYVHPQNEHRSCLQTLHG